MALDVTSDDATIQAALQKAVDTYGKITHCINAAGYILSSGVEEASAKEVFDEFNTNVLGVMNVTRNVLRHMRERRQGVIANFGSLGSWRGGTAYGYYSAVKFAISGFTESLHDEVKPLGIAAVAIEPGYFRTGFLNPGGGNRLGPAHPLDEEYKDTAVPSLKKILNQVDNNQPGDVKKGAKVIVDVLTQTGVAQGKEIPIRLILGADALEVIRTKIADTEAIIKEWYDVIVSTDHDDVKK
ncbi:NAD(P)-binding protein [Hypoxylon trugodes]|uniref:NAD(P)-binding protein n=1 Tax=Hypoxylon trugodes TaxID=326681 RepID=UPI00219BFF0F|nr:NAD(P)-binding protein [Hypoxylon trugodes]KAI1391046.1 NAD(P)-binding protein [Hypoxylon trugodes]